MDLHLLNKEQKIAVEHQKGPLLVLSGAGTGKTRVLTSRFVYIVKNLNFDFNRIIAVTFTNKAANEIKERVNKALERNIESTWIGTFHSIFAKFLRKHAQLVSLKSNFNILDSEDQKKLIKQVLEYCKVSKEVSENIYLNEIQNLKDEKIFPEDKNKILKYFEILKRSVTTKNRQDLLTLKKALYLIKISDIKDGNELLNNLISSESILKPVAEELLKK